MARRLARRAEPEVMDDAQEAAAYAQADFADVNQAFVERLLELVGPAASVTALDLGTGPCDIPVRLRRARPGWRIVAVEASCAMVAFARPAAQRASVCLLLADAKRLPCAACAFDVIFSNSILHHLTEVDAFWGEVRRVARPGAFVLLRDLARPASAGVARRIVARYAAHESILLQEEYYRSLLSAYTPAEVRVQLRRNRLGNLRVAMVSDRHLDVFGRVEE